MLSQNLLNLARTMSGHVQAGTLRVDDVNRAAQLLLLYARDAERLENAQVGAHMRERPLPRRLPPNVVRFNDIALAARGARDAKATPPEGGAS